MTHAQVLAGDVVDGYVTKTLDAADRAAFEEHMFTCDECFLALQAADRLRAGVRELGRRGEIDPTAAPTPSVLAPTPSWAAARYLPWLAVAATLVVAATSFLSQQRRYEDLRAQLDGVRDRHGELQQELDRAKADAAERSRVTPEANLPVAILQGVRSANPRPSITLAANTSRFVVWIEDPPRLTPDTVMTLSGPDAGPVATVTGLRLNQQGAVVAAFPAAPISTGSYVVRLTAAGRVLGEYPLTITGR